MSEGEARKKDKKTGRYETRKVGKMEKSKE